MKVLIACEFSNTVSQAFRKLGHEVWSCDFLPTDAKDDSYHYQGDIKDFFDEIHTPGYFDLMIAHPPCTYLTIAAATYFDDVPMFKGKPKRIGEGTLIGQERRDARDDALAFVDWLYNLDIPKVCIENPVGFIPRMLPHLPKPQYIQPYEFGHDASKKTGLWLKNLPRLKPTEFIEPKILENGAKRWANQTPHGSNNLPPSKDRWKIRSKTYQGVADAMAQQWSN